MGSLTIGVFWSRERRSDRVRTLREDQATGPEGEICARVSECWRQRQKMKAFRDGVVAQFGVEVEVVDKEEV